MRKFFLLMLSLVMALGVLPATAAPVDELTDLARYYPEDTAFFGAVRTDDAYIETLNGLAQRLSQRLPMIPEDFTIQEAIFTDIDFNEGVRPWLGDTAAVGFVIEAVEQDPTFIGAIAITNRDAAQVFLSGVTADNNFEYTLSDVRGGTLYQAEQGLGDHFLLLDDVLLFTSGADGLQRLQTEVDAPLSENDNFNMRLAALPDDDYNAALYGDLAFIAPIVAENSDFAELQQLGLDVQTAFEALGEQAAGLTILDDRSLVIDLATDIDDIDALEAAGFPVTIGEPVDLAFLSNVPADAPLVLLSRDFGSNLLNSVNQLEQLGNMADEQFESGELSFSDQSLTQLDQGAAFIRLSFEGMSGATLDEAFGWMTGAFANYLTPQITEAGLPGLNTALLIEATDTAAAESFVTEWVPNYLSELGIETRTEGDTLVTPLISEITGNMSDDLLAATDGDVLALGMRDGVEFALGDDDGLPDDATFQTARQWFLPETHSLAYVNVAPLLPVVEELAQTEPDFQMLAALLPVLESASITVTNNDDGSGNSRLVLTLAE